jgi:hypothetical protein
MRALGLCGLLLAVAADPSFAQDTAQSSKLVAGGVLQGITIETPKLKGTAVLQGIAVEAAKLRASAVLQVAGIDTSKLVAYAVLQTVPNAAAVVRAPMTHW